MILCVNVQIKLLEAIFVSVSIELLNSNVNSNTLFFFFFQDLFQASVMCQVSLLCFKKLSNEAAVEHRVERFLCVVLFFLCEQTLCPGQTSAWGQSSFSLSDTISPSEINLNSAKYV